MKKDDEDKTIKVRPVYGEQNLADIMKHIIMLKILSQSEKTPTS